MACPKATEAGVAEVSGVWLPPEMWREVVIRTPMDAWPSLRRVCVAWAAWLRPTPLERELAALTAEHIWGGIRPRCDIVRPRGDCAPTTQRLRLLFRSACRVGHLAVVRLVVDRLCAPIWHARAFLDGHELQAAARHGQLAVLEWLAGLQAFRERPNGDAVLAGLARLAMMHGHSDVADRLLAMSGWDEIPFDRRGVGHVLHHVCARGQLAAAQHLTATVRRLVADRRTMTHDPNWYWHDTDPRIDDNIILRAACAGGHLATAQWFAAEHGLTACDVHARRGYALRLAKKRGHRAVVAWILGTFGTRCGCSRHARSPECTAHRGERRRPRWRRKSTGRPPRYWRGMPDSSARCHGTDATTRPHHDEARSSHESPSSDHDDERDG